MKKLITFCLAACVSVAAHAEDDWPEFVWNYQTLDTISKGNPRIGKQLAQEYRCAKCHGDHGVSEEDDTPSLAGMGASYTFKQLYQYKTEARDNRTMRKQVRRLSVEDMAHISAYYAALKGEPMQGAPTRQQVPDLVIYGDDSRYLIACDFCHGPKGRGYGHEGPRIGGQKIQYLLDTMTEFREGDRANDHFGRMRFIATQLTEEEIESIVAYYAAKPIVEEE